MLNILVGDPVPPVWPWEFRLMSQPGTDPLSGGATPDGNPSMAFNPNGSGSRTRKTSNDLNNSNTQSDETDATSGDIPDESNVGQADTVRAASETDYPPHRNKRQTSDTQASSSDRSAQRQPNPGPQRRGHSQRNFRGPGRGPSPTQYPVGRTPSGTRTGSGPRSSSQRSHSRWWPVGSGGGGSFPEFQSSLPEIPPSYPEFPFSSPETPPISYPEYPPPGYPEYPPNTAPSSSSQSGIFGTGHRAPSSGAGQPQGRPSELL